MSFFGVFSANKNTPGRNRTCDTLIRNQALYPLSYGRMVYVAEGISILAENVFCND